jgi:hypothetical protein
MSKRGASVALSLSCGRPSLLMHQAMDGREWMDEWSWMRYIDMLKSRLIRGFRGKRGRHLSDSSDAWMGSV